MFLKISSLLVQAFKLLSFDFGVLVLELLRQKGFFPHQSKRK